MGGLGLGSSVLFEVVVDIFCPIRCIPSIDSILLAEPITPSACGLGINLAVSTSTLGALGKFFVKHLDEEYTKSSY